MAVGVPALERITPRGRSGSSALLRRLARFGVPIAMLAGVALVTVAFAIAENRPANDQLHYLVFWAGMLLATVPALLRLLGSEPGRAERFVLVLSVGLISYLPKFLRDPSGVVFHDEWAHYHQVQLIGDAGHTGVANPLIGIIANFPGLHVLTLFLQEVGGLGRAPSVALAIGLPHALSIVGLFLLAESVLRSARAASVASLLYILNSSYVYFDSQFGYESLAIPMMIWAFLAIERARTAVDRPRQRWGWFALALVLVGQVTITHHLTSYIMVLVSLLFAVVAFVRGRRGTSDVDRTGVRMTIAFAVVAIVLAGSWATFEASGVRVYLEPRITQGFQQLNDIVKGQNDTKSRKFFAKSTIPLYERIAGFTVPLIALFAIAGACLDLRRRVRERKERLSDFHLTLVALALMYLPSFPLLFSIAGQEGARRSWATSYVGVAVVVAPWIISRWSAASARTQRRWRRTLIAIPLCYALTLVGGTAIGQDETYRFPGPYVYGSDTRSITPALRNVARWVPNTYGINNRTITDRYNGLLIGTVGGQVDALPSPGFPVWQLYFNRYPSPFLLGQLVSSDQQFLVVDRNMSTTLPRIGVYFDPDEPLATFRDDPVPAPYLAKFERLPWTIKVMQAGDLNFYRFSFGLLNAPAGSRYR